MNGTTTRTTARYADPAPRLTVAARAATEPGALDGFAVTCSLCGPVGASSILSLAHQHADAHERWHAGRRRQR